MLEKLLAVIRLGGTLEIAKLAARLDTSPEMIRAMLEQLQRQGYIQPYRSCGEGCGGCGLRNECSQHRLDGPASRPVLLFMLAD